MSIMTLDFLPELDNIDFWCIYRGGSRISGKVFICTKHGIRFSDYISFFLNNP